jgi:mannosyltransferase
MQMVPLRPRVERRTVTQLRVRLGLERVARFAAENPLLLVIVAAGGLVRFATLGSQGFWYDELFTIEAIREGGDDVLWEVLTKEGTPPLYYLIADWWKDLAGSGEFALRSISALAGTATIPVVFVIARDLTDRGAGLAAAALTAASPLLIWYSQEARAYALVTLLAALSFLFFVRVLNGGGVRWIWGWSLVSGLALFSHYFAAPLVAIEAVWLLRARREHRGEVLLGIGGIATTLLLLLPLALAQQGRGDWIGELGFGDRLAALPQHLIVGLASPWELLGPLVAVVAVAGAVLGFIRARGRARSAIVLAATATGAGALLILLAPAVASDSLITRNLLALWAPFAVAMGIALTRPELGAVGPAAVTVLATLGVGLSVWTAATPDAGRPDWDPLVRALGEPAGPRVVVTPPLSSALVLELDGARWVEPGEGTTATEFARVELRRVDDYSIGPCWWLGFCGGKGLLVGTEPPLEAPPGFEFVKRGTTELFKYELYAADRPLPVPPSTAYEGVFLQAAQGMAGDVQ